MSQNPVGVCTLEQLQALDGDAAIAEALAGVTGALDTIYMERNLERSGVAETSIARGAWASAALEGAEFPWGEMPALESARDEPLVRVVRAAMRATTASVAAVNDRALGAFGVLARIASAAGIGFVPDDELGRPRGSVEADDPLNLGEVIFAEQKFSIESGSGSQALPALQNRLAAIATLWNAPHEIPVLIVAGAVHAELALARPFVWGSGLVARAVPRYLLMRRGLDPAGLLTPEMGIWRSGRPSYVKALRAYARRFEPAPDVTQSTAEQEGLAAWVQWWLASLRHDGVLPR